eukprot:GEMP01030792.1.p1 GENE.GEMP01030792.1~~GEMP01030792.1.p1  ORF type:complete len:555 (+),score=143.49 GEMP01030792.1:56-1666(+)
MEDFEPFTLPPDDALFLLRDREKQLKKQKRDDLAKLKVWEKTTACTHKIPSVSRKFKEPIKSTDAADESLIPKGREKENMTDFVAKKREMFLVQMSLDVKKAEILKLDEKARAKEAALKKSTQMLDEDVTRFDTFLQANDAKAHKAMKHAEDMTKKKVEKQQKIKVLKTQISAVMSEISKHKEQKEEYVKLKRFLDKLTPNEWKEKQKDDRMERILNEKSDWLREKLDEISSKIHRELDEEDIRRGRLGEPELQGVERDQKRRKLRKKYPPQEQLEKEFPIDEEADDCPLYFQDQAQVLDIFTALEEQNLFLIQNAQETQQALEEIEQKFAETKNNMGQKSDTLKTNIDNLERKIANEKGKCEELKFRMQGENNATFVIPDTLLKELGHKVAEVHHVCGFESDHDPDTLDMLANIEAKLEELFCILDEQESTTEGKETVIRLEREKEKERRDHVRAERVEMQNRKNDERLRKTLQRSQAPVPEKVGKPIMFRSYVANKVKKVVKESDDTEEAEKNKKLFGIYMQGQQQQAKGENPS